MQLYLHPDEVQVFHEEFEDQIVVPSGLALAICATIFGIPVKCCPGIPRTRALFEWKDSSGKTHGKAIKVTKSTD